MSPNSSTVRPALLVCAAVILLVGATAGVTAGANSTSNVLDGTTSTLENTTEATDDGLEKTTETTTDGLEKTTETTDNGLEDAAGNQSESDGSAETVDNETIGLVDGTVDATTEVADTTLDETGSVIDPIDTGTMTATAGVETEVDVSSATAGGTDTANATAGRDEPAPAGNADGTRTATDAVLVGLLGAATASGAAAGGAGTSGAAGTAGGTTAAWLRRHRVGRGLQLAGSVLPWKVLPLFRYSRYDDSDPLEHDRRRAIYETIESTPDCYLARVSDRTDIPLSTVRHHVRVLEDESLVTAVKGNGKRRYFLDAEGAKLRAALAEPAKRAVLELLADLGSAPNGRLADELERDPSTVSHHLSALEDDGLVVREKDGRSIVNELPPAVEAALVDEAATSVGSRPASADD